jgi:perosamine synthetase
MIPLFKPYMPKNLPEVKNILHSGKLNYGKWGRMFESLLADYLGNPLVLTTNSYNSAFLVAITTLGLQAGDTVIASPMSCLASNQPFASMGVKIIWADIDPLTGTLDPQDVKSKINPDTKAIVHNHYCGYAGYVSEMENIAREYGLYLIDDAIEAFGTTCKNKPIGALGADITVFSFQTIRLPNTIDGGGLSFRDKSFYNKSLLVRDYGIDRSRFRDERGEISPACNISLAGYGALMPELNSYIGCMQMSQIESLLGQQRNNALNYNKQFKNMKGIKPLRPLENTHPNFWVYGMLVSDKNKMIEEFRKNGIYASSVHLPNNNYSLFGHYRRVPGVEKFYNKFVAIPCGWWLC